MDIDIIPTRCKPVSTKLEDLHPFTKYKTTHALCWKLHGSVILLIEEGQCVAIYDRRGAD